MFEDVKRVINEYFGRIPETPLPEPPRLEERDLDNFTMTGIPREIDRARIRPGGVYDQREVKENEVPGRNDHIGPKLGHRIGDSQVRYINNPNTQGEEVKRYHREDEE